jgi:hypothetical protein
MMFWERHGNKMKRWKRWKSGCKWTRTGNLVFAKHVLYHWSTHHSMCSALSTDWTELRVCHTRRKRPALVLSQLALSGSQGDLTRTWRILQSFLLMLKFIDAEIRYTTNHMFKQICWNVFASRRRILFWSHLCTAGKSPAHEFHFWTYSDWTLLNYHWKLDAAVFLSISDILRLTRLTRMTHESSIGIGHFVIRPIPVWTLSFSGQ